MLCAWHYDGAELKPIAFRDETGDKPWLAGQIDSIDGNRCFTVRATRYILGTYRVQRVFAIGSDGVFAPVEDSCWQLTDNSFWLELRCDLPGKKGEESVTLPAGSHLLLNATDGVSWLEFLTEDYSAVRVPARRVDGFWQVAGMDENEVFVILPYAG
jgi:hypothetical protein